jgi:photosystem II stability/assembly factor-like uncharacterized protein
MKKIYILLIALFIMNIANSQWIQQNSGTSNGLYAVHFTNAKTGYIAGEAGIILKTTDGGITWTPQSSRSIFYLNSIYFLDSITGYIAGEGVVQF